ncbi:hypothetical protein [Pedobacter sp. ASV12]|uniref:hypothetical protein n=1 Tax=Pedobacter sp. ASV12 TaxID=2795120 RepID=UPI0018ED0F09|nr:hypothetical protein [Pedobacter sp. ASV12]
MKTVYYFVLLCLLSTTYACTKLNSDHPQANMADEHATDLDSKSILHYADSVDKGLSQLAKSTSLVYMLGDLSFYVDKYSDNGQPIVLIEHGYNGLSNNTKKYYFRNDSLILETVRNELSSDNGTVLKDTRTYLRNNTVFKVENRTAADEAAIKNLPFIDLTLSEANTSDHSYLEKIKTLDQILSGSDKFDMVFENITTFPDSRYIMLKSKLQNSYTASILVKEKDALIDSLLNSPIDFKDQKLNLKWIVQDQEAVYVPVASQTSAKGLKR